MSVELMQAKVDVGQMEIKVLHINSHVYRVDASFSDHFLSTEIEDFLILLTVFSLNF
jgi:hypothetical protein